MVLEGMLASVVAPAVIDFLKSAGGAVSRKWFGMSVDDQIKLGNADVERLKALAELDNPHGTPSQWVVDLRAAYRYIAATLVIFVGCGVLYGASKLTGVALDSAMEMGFALVSSPFCFIFGERLMLSLKSKK